jgi:acetaldehyde dehydrogenase
MIGVDPASDGLIRAAELGVRTSAGGVDWLLEQEERPDLVFEATSAGAHRAHAPRYTEAGIQAVDLTPAAIGPFTCPVVNLPGQRVHRDHRPRDRESVGRAAAGKAVIIINPVEPPMIMRDTVFCAIHPDADRDAISASIERMVADVREYVPGYTLKADPQYDDPRPDWKGFARVAVFLEVAGNGDQLSPYAGNLDIMTAAAARVGELLAGPILAREVLAS